MELHATLADKRSQGGMDSFSLSTAAGSLQGVCLQWQTAGAEKGSTETHRFNWVPEGAQAPKGLNGTQTGLPMEPCRRFQLMERFAPGAQLHRAQPSPAVAC